MAIFKTTLKCAIMLALLPVAAGCATDEPPTTSTTKPGNGNTGGSENGNGEDKTEGDVIFMDDFEGTSTIPDQSKWVLCERASSNWARHLSESYDQAYQKDGYLYLTGEMVNGEYQTGAIETRGKFDFQYGKVECRARFLRQPHGGHTGIWMMPAPPAEKWPKSGEIDIMEHLNADKLIYETVHSWYIDDMGHTDPTAQRTVDVDNTEWNTYGVVWTTESISYTVNGETYLSYPNLHLADAANAAYQWPFDHPFYLILSQSLGGADPWAGAIDDAELPAIFQIDWIKVTSLPSE